MHQFINDFTVYVFGANKLSHDVACCRATSCDNWRRN